MGCAYSPHESIEHFADFLRAGIQSDPFVHLEITKIAGEEELALEFAHRPPRNTEEPPQLTIATAT